jgi:hypothetical protein
MLLMMMVMVTTMMMIGKVYAVEVDQVEHADRCATSPDMCVSQLLYHVWRLPLGLAFDRWRVLAS